MGDWKLPVFTKSKAFLGYCTVQSHKLIGSKFMVVLALESELCQACGIKHTDYHQLIYDICFFKGDIALMVRSADDAKHLPEFKKAQPGGG